jgi:hypothetical protein
MWQVMQHDFRLTSDEATGERFCKWLGQETVDALKRSRGDAEATKGVIFLFVNRAYESHYGGESYRCHFRSLYRESRLSSGRRRAGVWVA